MSEEKCDCQKTLEELQDQRQPCEIWSRVMGYHRPVSAFNIGKKAEFDERKPFVERWS